MNQQRPLKDEPILSASEFADAILGAISDGTTTGRARQLGIALLHQALQAVNPLQLQLEDVTLYDRASSSGLPQSSKTVPVQLDIRTGSTRHNFNDGYFAFTFLRSRTNYTFKDTNAYHFGGERFVFKDRWFATQDGNEVIRIVDRGVTRTPGVWKASNTSFFAFLDNNHRTDIYRIVGHRLAINLQNP